MNAFTSDLLDRLAWSLPFYFVICIALWVCAKHKTRHRGLSNQFSLAFVLFASQSILGTVNRAWFSIQSSTGNIHPVSLKGTIYGITSGVVFLLTYVAWAILILAMHRALQGHAGCQAPNPAVSPDLTA